MSHAVVRGEGLKLSMSQYLIDQIASKANIEVRLCGNSGESFGSSGLVKTTS
jgi:hypothetical protein